MLFLIFIVTVFCVWLMRVHLDQQRKRVNLPGPKGIPIFGNMFQMNPKVHLEGVKLHSEHGKLVYNRVLNNHIVQIGDAKLAKELLSLDALSGRPVFPLFLIYEGEPFGVGASEGEFWEIHRRFTLRQLRDFGFGKNTMESLIIDEVTELVQTIKNKNSEPVGQIKELFSLAVVNSLWTLVNGTRLRQDDPSIRIVANGLTTFFTEPAKSGGLIFLVPWLRYIFPEKIGYTSVRQCLQNLKDFILNAVNEHKRTFQPDSCRDFIDVYLKEIQSTTDPNSTFYGEAGEKQLVGTVSDLFFAGTDTTSTTLSWAVLYLAKNQQVQNKLHGEIDRLIGDTRHVSTSDRANMPYTLATIDEILRMSSILPSGVFHRATSDVTHDGVTYPKGTMIGTSIYWIHYNPATWTDPENFRPERFLSEDESSYKKNDNLIAFSVGKRHCLGEALARESLFLFLGNIFQNFKIICDPNQPEPSIEPAPGFSLNPQEYSVIFKSRN